MSSSVSSNQSGRSGRGTGQSPYRGGRSNNNNNNNNNSSRLTPSTGGSKEKVMYLMGTRDQRAIGKSNKK